MPLSEAESARYLKQSGIEDWSEEAQLKLKQATVFVAGAGGLGSPVLFYLAGAGVGQLRVCDYDEIEVSNLNRQILHSDDRIGTAKSSSAAATISGFNPDITISPVHQKITEENAEDLVADASILVDCLDNLETRHVLNRVAVRRSIPLVHAGVGGFRGQISFLHPPHTPCLACFMPPGITGEPVYVLGATAGVMGSLQAMEVIKFLTGLGQTLSSRLLFWDGLTMNWDSIELPRNPACPVCSEIIFPE